ncbi:CPBP family intramembrane metalloprotease [Candidatus Gottesmanbacteria bacterium]|nr:CPBP family intramembrane metalloprotease [Candidatus Gottesmanbacteria bacterium]
MASKKLAAATGVLRKWTVYEVWGLILLVWALYRYYVKLPEWADEFIFKPLIFVVPIAWYVSKKEKRPMETLGLTTKNFFKSVYIGLGFGFLFAAEGLLVNYVKYGKININPIEAYNQYGLVLLLILSLATAYSEELLSRGFVFYRVYEDKKNVYVAALISTLMFLMIHIPILVTSLHFTGTTLILFFVTDFILGLANSLLFFNTGSLVAPILVHLFWNMTVALYL